MIRESKPVGGYFVNDGSWPVGKLVMYRVFDPTPCLPPGARMEFDQDNNKYYVMLDGKRIKTGDVVEVDEDLMRLQHNPERMMLALARIRALAREYVTRDHMPRIVELTKCL